MIRLEQGGRIVTLSSVSGLMGNRGQVESQCRQSRPNWRDQGFGTGTGKTQNYRELCGTRFN